MSGKSQVVRISSGVDSWSEKNRREKFRPVSSGWLRSGRLIRLMIKPCIVMLIHMVLLLDNQVSGMSIAVGTMIFSIEVSLGFVRGLVRMYLTL